MGTDNRDITIVCLHTRDGVVEDKPEESSDEHVRGEQHDDDLVQLFDSCKNTQKTFVSNNNLVSINQPSSSSTEGQKSGFKFKQLKPHRNTSFLAAARDSSGKSELTG